MEVFIFATGNLPAPWEHPILARRTARYISRLPGLLGIHPSFPNGTLLVFGTRTHAEKAMRKMGDDMMPVSDCVMRGTVERDSDGNFVKLTVIEPADGWTKKEKEQIEQRRESSSQEGAEG